MITEHHDIVYNKTSGNKCDIYTTSALVKTPICIMIHGGAWVIGSRSKTRSQCSYLCKQAEVSVVAPEYALSQLDSITMQNCVLLDWLLVGVLCLLPGRKNRRMPLFILICVALFFTVALVVYLLHKQERRENVHPAHMNDIVDCLNWVHHGADFPLPYADRDHIFLIGHSAGAHLSALVTLNARAIRPETRRAIRGVIGMCGVYSFWELQSSWMRHFVNRGVFAESCRGLNQHNYARLEEMRKCNCAEKCRDLVARWDHVIDAWPNLQLEHNKAMAFDNHAIPYPAFLLFTVELDLSLINHSTSFATTLRKHQFPVQHLHFPQQTHFSVHEDWNTVNTHIPKAIIDFMQHVLKHC